jgi:hypothetical protein
MKYLQSFNESKSIIGSKPKRDKKPKYDLESIFFDMIIDDIKGHYGNNFEDLTEDMNFQEDLDDWIHWIQKHTHDDTKRMIGGYFQKYYFYIKKNTEQKKRLKEYIKTELLNYLSDN